MPATEGIRINKFLASCGLGSRRKVESLIEEHRVTINGNLVTGLGTRVSPEDSVKVDGKRVRGAAEFTLLFYKPKGYLCTREDTHDRKTIYDILPPKYGHLAYVGRLDKESEGLLLLTSDGALSQRLTHPSHQIEKEYHVLLEAPLDRAHATKFLEGVRTPEGIARAERVESMGGNWVSIVLKQGLKRQIRLMCGKFGHEVKRLVRVRIGLLVAPGLKPGEFVELGQDGLDLLSKNPR
ncbi:MAG: pseudouridine synthase [Verrucomicrobiales bacterium]